MILSRLKIRNIPRRGWKKTEIEDGKTGKDLITGVFRSQGGLCGDDAENKDVKCSDGIKKTQFLPENTAG